MFIPKNQLVHQIRRGEAARVSARNRLTLVAEYGYSREQVAFLSDDEVSHELSGGDRNESTI